MAPAQPLSIPPTTLPNTLPVVIPVPVSVPAPPQSFLTRTQKFIEDNQKLLILGAAVLAAGGGYYYYSNTRDLRSGGADDGSSSSKKSKKKKGKKGGGGLRGEGTDGPLLEEITPVEKPGVQQESRQDEKVENREEGQVQEKEDDRNNHLRGIPEKSALDTMSTSERDALGAELKDRGNKLYSQKEFTRAVDCYTKAIEVSIRKDAVFYSNRAACYTNFSPPEYHKCVADCDEALKLDKLYLKALKRRATALENLGQDEEAVRDFTALSVIEGFKNEANANAVDRCLSKLASKKGKEMFESREPKLPSPTFISSYLASFRPHPKPTLPENPSQGDQTLSLAFDAVAATDYAHAVSFANEAIEQGISSKEGQAEAYNLRGTFKFLMSDAQGAKADLEKSLDIKPDLVQSWVKIASVHMELGDPAGAFGDFEAAIRHNENDPDIYYHRGQVYFISSEFDKAIADYTKSTQLDDTFIFTHVQHAVATYKKDTPSDKAHAMAAFRKILKQFPERGEPSNYYGELLLDQEKFEESVQRFDKSLELDKNKKPRNVLPLVNKALAIFQWKQDLEQSRVLCEEALSIDPECDVAVATLAQLSLQSARLDDAIMYFGKSAALGRTELEVVNALTYEYASRSQKDFIRNYPEFAEKLGAMAQGMAQ